ncbi:uncharacterized protein LOC111273626 [Varroa jacobsoni]|uniref:uncharacterized protein LOC111273626 n=1 Tax=Varroa jacobsoni TaxID=62625 RepID=UPI000BF87EAA|nr:uncharacterized protein LOC111273626 [Varroa jacobsoni]
MSDKSSEDINGSYSASTGSLPPARRADAKADVVLHDENAMSGDAFHIQQKNQGLGQTVDKLSQPTPSRTGRKVRPKRVSSGGKSDKQQVHIESDKAEKQPAVEKIKSPSSGSRTSKSSFEIHAVETSARSNVADNSAGLTPPTRRRPQSESPLRRQRPKSRGRQGRPENKQPYSSPVFESPDLTFQIGAPSAFNATVIDESARQGYELELVEPEDNTQIYEENLEKFLQQKQQNTPRRESRYEPVLTDFETPEKSQWNTESEGTPKERFGTSPKRLVDVPEGERSPEASLSGIAITQQSKEDQKRGDSNSPFSKEKPPEGGTSSKQDEPSRKHGEFPESHTQEKRIRADSSNESTSSEKAAVESEIETHTQTTKSQRESRGRRKENKEALGKNAAGRSIRPPKPSQVNSLGEEPSQKRRKKSTDALKSNGIGEKQPENAQSDITQKPTTTKRKKTENESSKKSGRSIKKKSERSLAAPVQSISRKTQTENESPHPTAKSGKLKENEEREQLSEPILKAERATSSKSDVPVSVPKARTSKKKQNGGKKPGPASKSSKATEARKELSDSPMKSGKSKKQPAEQASFQPPGVRRKKGRSCVACGKALTWNYIALNCNSCQKERCRLCLDCPCRQTSNGPKRRKTNDDQDESEPNTSGGTRKSRKKGSSMQSKATRDEQARGKRKARDCVVCARNMHFNYRSVACDVCKRERCRDCPTCVCENSD